MTVTLPEAFVRMLPLDEKESSELTGTFSGPAPVSIRLNRRKALLTEELISVPWSTDGYYLPERPRFTSDPAFHAGAYYVQEASSMFLGFIVRQLGLDQKPLIALDLCAAPGGKSTLLRSELHPDSLLVANEVVPSRAHILEENLIKWGIPGFAVAQSDASDFGKLTGLFDLIVVDAPCSGEGLFRKNPKAIDEWSPAAVETCVIRQRKILADIWPALTPGGILIYSTCTFNRLENEENLQCLRESTEAEWIRLKNVPPEIVVSEENDTVGYRFYPHRVHGEGFFISVLRKPTMGKEHKQKKGTNRTGFNPVNFFHENSGLRAVSNQREDVFAIQKQHLNTIQQMDAAVNLRSPGFPIGRTIRGDFKPAQGAAMIISEHRGFDRFELDLEQALRYLQREDVYVDHAVRGLVVVQFDGFPLGFAKANGNRLVSQYPNHWRVRTGEISQYKKLVNKLL